MMPVLDGITATRVIGEIESCCEVPIVAVTAYDKFYSDKALEAGCREVIEKPLEFSNPGSLPSRYLY